jgi:hypothetical protein
MSSYVRPQALYDLNQLIPLGRFNIASDQLADPFTEPNQSTRISPLTRLMMRMSLQAALAAHTQRQFRAAVQRLPIGECIEFLLYGIHLHFEAILKTPRNWAVSNPPYFRNPENHIQAGYQHLLSCLKVVGFKHIVVAFRGLHFTILTFYGIGSLVFFICFLRYCTTVFTESGCFYLSLGIPMGSLFIVLFRSRVERICNCFRFFVMLI